MQFYSLYYTHAHKHKRQRIDSYAQHHKERRLSKRQSKHTIVIVLGLHGAEKANEKSGIACIIDHHVPIIDANNLKPWIRSYHSLFLDRKHPLKDFQNFVQVQHQAKIEVD